MLGESPLPAKRLFCFTSAYYHHRTGREEKEVSQRMKEELVETKGMAEGREIMEMPVMKQEGKAEEYCGKKNKSIKRKEK